VPQAHTLRVASLRIASPLTRIVRLALEHQPFVFRAGQSVRMGMHGQPLRKYYSIASAPEDAVQTGFLEFLVRLDAEGDAGTHLVGLKRGALVDIEGPFGTFVFPDRPAEGHFLFIGGGTGIAPLRSMLRHALAIGCPGRFSLLYSARSTDEFPYLAELRRLGRAGVITLVMTATRDAGERWRGGRGRIDRAVLLPLLTDPRTRCFVCGPAEFTATVPPLLRELGVPSEQILTGES
jgi:NAD(P)H-flavin reductase